MQTSPHRGRSRHDRIGPLGALARAAVGAALILYELLGREPRWQDAPLGLVVLPALVVGAALLWSRRSSEPLRAIGPAGHTLNVLILLPFVFIPATAGAVLLFYGASMLLAAATRNGGCEVTAVSNTLLHRDDQVGCVLFAPVDVLEAQHGS